MSGFKKMDAKWKKRWLKALRTPADQGGYIQGKGALVQENRSHYVLDGLQHYSAEPVDLFCCLGVLTNLMVEKKCDVGGKAWDSSYMSTKASNIADLGYRARKTVAVMNDNGTSFGEIADWIEVNL